MKDIAVQILSFLTEDKKQQFIPPCYNCLILYCGNIRGRENIVYIISNVPKESELPLFYATYLKKDKNIYSYAYHWGSSKPISLPTYDKFQIEQIKHDSEMNKKYRRWLLEGNKGKELDGGISYDADDPTNSHSMGYDPDSVFHKVMIEFLKEKEKEAEKIVINNYSKNLKEVLSFIKKNQIKIFDGVISQFDFVKHIRKNEVSRRIKNYDGSPTVSFFFNTEGEEASGKNSNQWTDVIIEYDLKNKNVILLQYNTRLQWWIDGNEYPKDADIITKVI